MGMSEAEKAANKAAQKVRDAAYAKRVREMRAAVNGAEASEEVQSKRSTADALDAELEARRRDAEDRVKKLRARIRELEEEINGIEADPAIKELANRRRLAYSDWSEVRNKASKEAEDRFEDLSGNARFSVTAWKPPQEVLEAMEAARKASLASSAKK